MWAAALKGEKKEDQRDNGTVQMCRRQMKQGCHRMQDDMEYGAEAGIDQREKRVAEKKKIRHVARVDNPASSSFVLASSNNKGSKEY